MVSPLSEDLRFQETALPAFSGSAAGISFLLVTHDAYTASFCDRVLFLQDGNLAKEVKKENTADNFREDIWKTLCGLGGGKDDLF